MLPSSTVPAYIFPNSYYFLPRCLLRPTLRRLLASTIDLCIVAMWFLACNLQPHQAGEPTQVSVPLVAKVDLNHLRALNSFAFATSFSHFYLREMAQRVCDRKSVLTALGGAVDLNHVVSLKLNTLYFLLYILYFKIFLFIFVLKLQCKDKVY